MARILATNLDVEFPLYHASSRSLKKTLLARTGIRLASDRHERLVVQALRGLSFDIRAGDRVGLVGPNGAGKTTLLRVLAGIYYPVRGYVEIEGEVASLLELSAGMNMSLTGRENAQLYGELRGLDRAEIRRLIEDAYVFSDLKEFFDLPLKGYSAGMLLRLGFALATYGKPQILLMDEWILAGDASFRAKAAQRLERLVTAADILVLASHDQGIIEKWCTRVFRLEDGQLQEQGPPIAGR